ncbi:O-antigen polymerase [Pseudomonas fragi]|uniref:Oligosaccharide repeat unit polymerase n=1 Tax=Pseudomonas fragi TaxID=296 RepID=A0A449IKV0_PSEFR|nr:O-antigen polymerase [Pseudomonas fragi]VFB20064.1 Uncharacterised protein [Pseudomonas fragi]
MKIKSWQFRPHNIILFTYSIVFIFWAFPSFDYFRKGFDEPLSLLSIGGLGLGVAITTAWCLTYLFYNIGKNKAQSKNNQPMPIRQALSDKSYAIFIALTFIGLIAVFYSLAKSGGISFIVDSIQTGRANELKRAMYEDYSVGIISLRYSAIMCGVFLIARRLSGVKHLMLDSAALVFVLCTALLSSRLTVSASLFGGLYIYIYFKKEVQISTLRVALSTIFIFLIFSVLNWSRNYGFYEKLGLGFISGGFSEMLAYLGTPFQGAVFAISNLGTGFSIEQMHSATTIESSLTTNSAFLELTAENSWLGNLRTSLQLCENPRNT